MWGVKYVIRKLEAPEKRSKKSLPIAVIKIIGEHTQPLTLIRLVWELRNGTKVTGRIPPIYFDKTKFKGDERLSRYLLKYFGPGYYSILMRHGKGFKSVFFGQVMPEFFIRYRRDGIMETGLAPYLTSTKPIGSPHAYHR